MIKLHFVEKFTEGDKKQQIDAMSKYFEFTDLDECDMLYCGSIMVLPQTLLAKNISRKPLAVFCWDYYLWAHEGKAPHWDWKGYQELLKQADIIFVPSSSQQRRLKELLNLESVVVKSGVRTYDDVVPSDGNFILDPLRHYPEENRDWAERAARRLGIPFIHSEHQYTEPEFRKLVASCTFMTSCVREASTGGLTLVEGLHHGKVSLVSDSPYMGAKDYLGNLGCYFKHDDFEDLVAKMEMLWQGRPRVPIERARKWISENLTFDLMAEQLHKHICNVLKK